MAARLISDYIASGLAASRPATPDVVAGTASYWYSTDTGELSIFVSGSWYTATTGSSGGPEIVQQGIAYKADMTTGITLGAAPTQGNILVAMVIAGSHTTPPGAGAGWSLIFSDTSVPDCMLAWRVVTGAAESATQTPTNDTDYGTISVWEISGAMNVGPTPIIDYSSISATSYPIEPATEYGIITGPCLLLGIVSRRDTSLPSGIAGATAGPTVTDAAGVATAMFSLEIAEDDTPTITATYGTSVATRRLFTLVS